MLQWLTVGPVLIVLAGHGTQVLLMAGRQQTLMYCSLTALAVYALALYPAVARFGVAGAAAVQSIVFSLLGCTVTVLAHKQVGVWTMATLRPSDMTAALRDCAEIGKNDRSPRRPRTYEATPVRSRGPLAHGATVTSRPRGRAGG